MEQFLEPDRDSSKQMLTDSESFKHKKGLQKEAFTGFKIETG